CLFSLEVLNDKYRYKNANRDETNYLFTMRQFFLVRFVAQRTKLFTLKIIVSMGQREFEINRLPGALRAKITVFL
ncbi:hypothetical protein, partial [Enterobacter soli]|uniref:hypothetical protein n=1 Tax=Enterobacter soli TaxID=885040 RepID=UPI0028995CE6